MTIEKHCLIVSLHISCYGGKKADKRITREVATSHQVERPGTFTKKLFGDDDKKLDKINNLAAAARVDAERHSLPWTRGSRLVPASKFMEYAEMLNKHKEAFDDAVEELAGDYQEMKEKAKESRKTMYDENDYPDDIRSCYAFSMKVNPVPTTTNFDEITGLNEEIEDLKVRLEEDLKEQQEEASKNLSDRLRSEIEHVLEQVNNFERGQGKLFKKNIEKLAETCKIIRGLNVFGDQRVDRWTNNIVNQTPGNPELLRVDRPSLISYQSLLDSAYNDLS